MSTHDAYGYHQTAKADFATGCLATDKIVEDLEHFKPDGSETHVEMQVAKRWVETISIKSAYCFYEYTTSTLLTRDLVPLMQSRNLKLSS